MKELIEKALAGGLQELAGLELSGTIPIGQDLINEVITETLEHGVPERSPDRPQVDANALIPYVKRARVSAENGRLTLQFEIKIDDHQSHS
ncbi:MAG: hypothetical protein QM758_00985 [Armatimonas sp.]